MKVSKKSNIVVFVFFGIALLFFFAVLFLPNLMGGQGSSTKEIDSNIVINKMTVDVDWNKDRSCKIKQNLTVEFYNKRHGIYVDIPLNSGEKIRNLSCTSYHNGRELDTEFSHEAGNNIFRIRVGDEDSYIHAKEQITCAIEYDYLTPVHPDGNDILDINAVGGGWTCYVKNVSINVRYPASSMNLSVVDGNGGALPYTQSDKKDSVSIQVDSLKPFVGVRVKSVMPSGTLTSRNDFDGLVTVIVGGVLLVVIVLLMLFLGRDKPVSPILGFYPPMIKGGDGKRMLPVQMGKIIDGTCSANDVTSLIFYWASEGFIMIDEREDDTYFVKLKEIEEVTGYERDMFNAIFRMGFNDGERRTVRLGALTGKFAGTVHQTSSAVNSEYRGKFYQKKYTMLSVFMLLAVALYAVFDACLATNRVAFGYYNPAGLVLILPLGLAAIVGYYIMFNYFKLSVKKRRLYFGFLTVGVILLIAIIALLVPDDAMGMAEKIIFAVCVGLSALICPFLTRRTDEYTDMLNDVLGFRDFLRDAEKEKLELLLADDPQYYYNILPYANVLGVSDIWEDKFASLNIEPPAYYHGNGVSVFDLYVLSRLTRSVGSSLTYTPPKASGGSFSGGGHSGGGGGFGGGGGGSW